MQSRCRAAADLCSCFYSDARTRHRRQPCVFGKALPLSTILYDVYNPHLTRPCQSRIAIQVAVEAVDTWPESHSYGRGHR
jgi:hypothetical protein